MRLFIPTLLHRILLACLLLPGLALALACDSAPASAQAAPELQTLTPTPGGVAPFDEDHRRPLFSGTAEAGAVVRVWGIAAPRYSGSLHGDPPRLVLCQDTANANGAWRCRPALALREGPNRVEIIVTDAAGRTAPPQVLLFTVGYRLNLPVINR